MTGLKQILPSVLLVLVPAVAIGKPARCPADSAAIPYHSLEGSLIGLSVTINQSGPYEFLVDTGAQITIIDPLLAGQLALRPQGSIGVVSVVNYASADLVKPELVEVGPAAVPNLLVAVQGLKKIQMANPKIRGILGENFLGRFDLLIDYRRKMICLDQSKELEKQIQGERVPVIEQTERAGDMAYTRPVLVTVHMPGDGKQGMVLRLDSGSNAPMLFQNRLGDAWWLQRNHAREGNVAGKGGALAFATMPAQEVEIGSHTKRQIAFLTPISEKPAAASNGEDGLLPTTLFNAVFISYSDHFVVFEPR
jgi:hypothetical protein